MLNSDPTVAMGRAAVGGQRLPGSYGPDAPTPGDLAYERLATAGLRDDIHRIMIPGIQHVGISDFPEILGAPAQAPCWARRGSRPNSPRSRTTSCWASWTVT